MGHMRTVGRAMKSSREQKAFARYQSNTISLGRFAAQIGGDTDIGEINGGISRSKKFNARSLKTIVGDNTEGPAFELAQEDAKLLEKIDQLRADYDTLSQAQTNQNEAAIDLRFAYQKLTKSLLRTSRKKHE